MDSRERVLAAVTHARPDRVPVDLWAEPGVWSRLRRDMGLATDEAVRDALSVDVRYISPVYPADTFTNGVRQNMWGERWEKTSTVFGVEWEHTRGVLHAAQSLRDVEAFPWPSCDQVDYSRLSKDVKAAEGRVSQVSRPGPALEAGSYPATEENSIIGARRCLSGSGGA